MANDSNLASVFSSCEYILRCAICYEEYSEDHPPVTLQCGHNFCKLCVKKLKIRKYFVKCPVDNIVKRINENSVNEEFLGTILLLKKIIEEESINRPQKRSVAQQCSDQHAEVKEKIRKTQKIVDNLETNLYYLYFQFMRLTARPCLWYYCNAQFPVTQSSSQMQ